MIIKGLVRVPVTSSQSVGKYYSAEDRGGTPLVLKESEK